MSISYQEAEKLITLQTRTSTWQMQISPYGHLLHLYYGAKIKRTNLSYLVRGINRGFSGSPYKAFSSHREYSLDTYPQEYSAFGVGDYRSSCLCVEQADGSQSAELIYQSHQIYSGKYALPGLPALWADKKEEAQTLEIHLQDEVSHLEVILYYGVFEEFDVITRACQIRNKGNFPVYLNKALSACLDFGQADFDILSFYGRHTMERILQRTSAGHGKFTAGSVRGTSSHHQNPFIILCHPCANEEYGECYGAALVYSGNFIAEIEVDQINQTRFTMGIHPDGFRYKLEKDEEFTAPEVVFSFSKNGYGALSRNYHHAYMKHLIRSRFKSVRRPILLNNWEAMQFDFDEEGLIRLAASAKELGVELFVLDDGWFGNRNQDISGLGDWRANLNKLPSGIGGLSRKIHALGLQFGLWIEPEMVNEDSDLYRNHPDWCMKIPGRLPNVERGQLVLDISRGEVREYLLACIDEILKESEINYIKWDMNRNLSDVWSSALPRERQGEVMHRYVLGLYELMEQLTSRYPSILWEGCSGGGGRFDAGILYYMPQIWCSDNTDAVERIRIQYGTSFGYPASSVGSHVSVSPNHQTGRETSMETRGIVAMAGSLGYELDVRKLSAEDREKIKRQIFVYKQYYHLIHNGDYYRLTNAEQNQEIAAWQFVSSDRTQALVSAVSLHAQSNPVFKKIRVKGLKEDSWYQINGKEIYEGSALMNGGINLPVIKGDNQGFLFVLQEIFQET